MRKYLAFFQVALISLMLIMIIGTNGCTQGGTKETGTRGITASFVENAPPINVNVNQNFPIYIQIKNEGDAFVNEGSAKFYLVGIGQNIQNVKSSLQNKNLLGPDAEEKLEFATAAKSTLELAQPLTVTTLLTSCYKYGGRAQADICISSTNQSKVCSITGEKISYNSAEPVQISSLTEEIVGNKLLISFTITNKGKGIVYLPDADCDKLQTKDINEMLKNDQVKIRVGSLGQGFSCKLKSLEAPYNSIESLEGAAPVGKISCEKSLDGIEEQKTALQINLGYTYVETLSQNILISPA